MAQVTPWQTFQNIQILIVNVYLACWLIGFAFAFIVIGVEIAAMVFRSILRVLKPKKNNKGELRPVYEHESEFFLEEACKSCAEEERN